MPNPNVPENGIGTVVADDPFYISPNETTSVTLVTDVLVGTKHYASWKKLMELALSGRSKLNFVRGEVPKPAANDVIHLAKWQRCNDVIMTWLISSVAKRIASGILHAKDAAIAWKTLARKYMVSHKVRTFALRKEIYTLTQGELPVFVFLEKLINLWDELDALLAEDIEYHMSGKAKEEEHVMSFLMGLNEKHNQIRSQILAIKKFPSLDDAYNMVAQDELQMEITCHGNNVGGVAAFYTEGVQSHVDAGKSRNSANLSDDGPGRGRNNGNMNHNKNRRNLICNHYGISGHVKENCYKLIGYPPNWKNKQQNNKGPGGSGGRPMAHTAYTNTTEFPDNNGQAHAPQSQPQLTQNQISQLLALISQPKSVGDQTNIMAGPCGNEVPRDW